MNNDINKIKAGAFFWNTASGVINAGQSAIILILISYFLTKIDAGIYTIAIAIGNIVSVFSKYGMRNYQVTDIEEKYNFTTHKIHGLKIDVFNASEEKLEYMIQ